MANYKDELNQQIIEAKSENENLISAFFDSSQSVEERLNAFESTGTFQKNDQVASALNILHDTVQDGAIRAAALKGLIPEMATNETLIDEVISYIKNSSIPVVLRLAALSVAQISTFSSPLFDAKMPAYTDALRTAIHDEDKQLRETAIEYLALKNDEYVQRVLLDGLDNPEKELIEPEVAIQLLSYDLHAEHFPILRKIAENPPNLRSKKEALRNLASDANSQDLLMKTLEDSSEDPELRHVCAIALQSLSPEYLQPIAKNLILDKNENEELKAALLNTLRHVEDRSALDKDTAFQQKLEDEQKDYQSPNLKQEYSQFVAERNNTENENVDGSIITIEDDTSVKRTPPSFLETFTRLFNVLTNNKRGKVE